MPPRTTAANPARSHIPLLAALVAVVALLGGACTTGSDDLASSSSDEQSPGDDDGLRWTGCLSEIARAADLECATLTVPVDRAEPGGESLELELARLPSTGGEPIGSLLVNPGGPGGSGIEYLATASAILPETLTGAFDVVTWDPRGVGESTPVWCLDDAAKDAQIEGDISPDEGSEVERAITEQAEFREGCEDDPEQLVRHMSTADVAGDMEEIREALGEDRISYLGFSYGTAIGATYATLFPERVRAMVLDGAVSPGADEIEQAEAQAQGFERTYQEFTSQCDATARCAISGQAAAAVEEARAALDAAPLPVDDRELTRDLFDIALVTGLYDTSVWGSVATAIDDLEGGGAEIMLSLADRTLGRNADGTWDNSWDAQAMVGCADSDYRPTASEALAEGEQLAESSPTFGETFRTAPLGCVDWPLAANPVPTWEPTGAPTILVVGTVGDPATPYEWSEEMAEALGDTYLLTYEGAGHTAFLRGGECVEDAVLGYLVDLEQPEGDLSCPAVAEGGGAFTDLAGQLVDELVAQGLPADVATCIADELEETLGAAGLEELLLSDDVEDLTVLVTEATLACVTGD